MESIFRWSITCWLNKNKKTFQTYIFKYVIKECGCHWKFNISISNSSMLRHWKWGRYDLQAGVVVPFTLQILPSLALAFFRDLFLTVLGNLKLWVISSQYRISFLAQTGSQSSSYRDRKKYPLLFKNYFTGVIFCTKNLFSPSQHLIKVHRSLKKKKVQIKYTKNACCEIENSRVVAPLHSLCLSSAGQERSGALRNSTRKEQTIEL